MKKINLVPKAEKSEQQKTRLVKVSTIISILVLVCTVVVSGYYFYRVQTLKDEIKAHEDSIARFRASIEDLADIEVSARNLSFRYKSLQAILAERVYYSVLLTELEKRVPPTVDIESFNLGQNNTIDISGTGQDYLAISDFISFLTDADFSDAGKDLGSLFTDVTLNTVSLDAQSGRVNYFIVVAIDTTLLNK